MRLRPTLCAAAGLAAGAALADGHAGTTMAEAQLDALLTGNTVYIAVPPGPAGGPEGGIAPFKYGADGSAAAALPSGLTLVGTWALDGDAYCVDWENGPKNSCTQVVKDAEGFLLVDRAEQAPRGRVTSLAPGNPEGL